MHTQRERERDRMYSHVSHTALSLPPPLSDDDIFSTPVAKTPKKKKGWMDDLLDDESELFKSGDKDDVIKPEPVEDKGAGLGGKSSGGGLFDDFSLDDPEDKPSASVNGHKGKTLLLRVHDYLLYICMYMYTAFSLGHVHVHVHAMHVLNI